MTSKKSSSYDLDGIDPFTTLRLAFQAVKDAVKDAVKTTYEFERFIDTMNMCVIVGRERRKKILAVALRPTRKRRVDAERFEFKN